MRQPRKELSDKKAVGIDGFARSQSDERELDELFVAAFGRGKGAEALAYLKQITTAVNGPEASDAVLRHQAGQRHLVYVIEARVARGSARRKKGE